MNATGRCDTRRVSPARNSGRVSPGRAQTGPSAGRRRVWCGNPVGGAGCCSWQVLCGKSNFIISYRRPGTRGKIISEIVLTRARGRGILKKSARAGWPDRWRREPQTGRTSRPLQTCAGDGAHTASQPSPRPLPERGGGDFLSPGRREIKVDAPGLNWYTTYCAWGSRPEATEPRRSVLRLDNRAAYLVSLGERVCVLADVKSVGARQAGKSSRRLRVVRRIF